MKDIEEYHIAYAIDFDDSIIDTFIARRPDGLAFDTEKKLCVLLEYTRAMDTVEDWAERKEQEKNERYGPLLGFINHLSHREKSGWKASQTNFTTGVRGSLHTNQFLTRLESLGVKNSNTREAIRNRTVQKTLSMSDMILKFFFRRGMAFSKIAGVLGRPRASADYNYSERDKTNNRVGGNCIQITNVGSITSTTADH